MSAARWLLAAMVGAGMAALALTGGPRRLVGIATDFEGGHVLCLVAHRIAGGFGEFVHVYSAAALKPHKPKRTTP